jgi:uncharacterized membrane protein HdeD (DUF308 family)
MNAKEDEAFQKALKELIELKKQQNASLEESIKNKDNFILFVGVICLTFGLCGLIWSAISNFIC